MKVKICGLTGEVEARAAAEAGADYLGLVFAPSRRQLDTDKASIMIAQLRQTHPCPEIVGVFVNRPAGEVNHIARICGLDRVQLSGEETWDYCRDIEKPLIKVIHVTPETRFTDVIQEIESNRSCVLEKRPIILLDSLLKGTFGGAGQVIDWRLAGEVSSRFPVMVAGGLTPENVARMISEVKPWGVDVSSGVETDGKKDIWKIQNFIQTASSCKG
jgi:phosphoribosylanthranilate isomerase